MKRDEIGASALAVQPITRDVLKEKYLKPGEEDFEDLFARVARALASVEAEGEREKWQARFHANLRAGAIGAGRIMSAAGTALEATLINCFVQPVGDCIQGMDAEGYPGIYEALREAAETMRRGGGVGYDFSRIRPRGAEVKATASIASGPCSYIDVFDHSCATVESAGARRGAQMGVLRIDHPDVMEFITAKRTPGRWSNFNVSVAVTQTFMQALEAGADWPLLHSARPGAALMAQGAHQREDGMWVYRSLPAAELWDTVMRSAYDFAEPGILFPDTINSDNNLRYCERIAATNPCGEQPLPPYGCCDLGPVILTRFVRHPFGMGGKAEFDFEAFAASVAVQVRALDNVLDLTYWPLPQQRAEAMAKRRIGVGFTGMGDTLSMLCLRYDQSEGRDMAVQIARRMRDAAYTASVALAREKGAFPAFNAKGYLETGTFASRLDEPLKQAIREHGIRNSHLLSIAPTGTVSLAFADNASNGIEPAFSWTYRRRKREGDGSVSEYDVEDHAWRLYRALGGDTSKLPEYFVSALAMPAGGHIAMMEAVQPFVDTAISKTVNVSADYPYEDFKELYREAWKAGLKGLATYRPNTIVGAVLQTNAPAQASAERERRPARPDVRSDRQAAQGRAAGGCREDRVLDPGGQAAPVPGGVVHGTARRARARDRVLHAGRPDRRIAAMGDLQHAAAFAGCARRVPGPGAGRHAQGRLGSRTGAARNLPESRRHPRADVARLRGGGAGLCPAEHHRSPQHRQGQCRGRCHAGGRGVCFGRAPDDGPQVPGVRGLRDDPQGRLRLLHPLRAPRRLRLKARAIRHGSG